MPAFVTLENVRRSTVQSKVAKVVDATGTVVYYHTGADDAKGLAAAIAALAVVASYLE